MAKVSLRKYIGEIEALIDSGQTDEAIAHCRHILQTHSKHIETYRMLGKAYLETKRHAEAADVFNRLLTAVPDDFVSHVGLSIIADEEKRLDDALWHMERAFEKQPSNAAIQAELQRLYGRRDGREPPKIRLTRGALAHMYYQGELYAQAVSEIRAVLAGDPNRADLQALLALACFRGGQKVEASETCSQLLSRFPYCLDANRVLVEILPGTGMAESVDTYRQRVVELDPYAAHAPASIFQSAEAPDAAVSLERLDYKGRPVEAAYEWSASLGLGLAAAGKPPEQPDWMKAGSEPQPAVPAPGASAEPFGTPPADLGAGAPAPAESQPPPAGGDAIPEWMRQAGWGESTGAFDESTSSLAGETSEPELATADLPDWIKAMAPAEAESPASPSAPPAAEETPDWLTKLGGEAPFAGMEETAQDAASAAAAADWLSKLDEQPPAAQETASAGEPAPGIGDLGASAAEQDAALLWLEGLAAKQGAKSEELITNPEERLESPPEWVERAKAAGEPPPPAAAPAWGEAALPEADLAAASADQTGAWLRELDAKESPPEKPAEAEPAAWSGEIEFAPPPAQPGAESASEADLPSWLRGADRREETSVPAGDVEAMGEIPDWLKGEEREEPAAPEPTRPADWTPEAASAPKPEPRKAPSRRREPEEAAPVDRSRVRRTGVLPPLVDPALAQARELLARAKIPDALQVYGNLIRKGKLLEEVTFDLKEALYRFPVEVSIWQALGDAFMRANRLQDALDAYTKAEELLR